MKTLVRNNVLALAVSLLGANYANAQTNVKRTAEPMRHTVMPGNTTAIHIQTMANAVCAFHPEDEKDDKQSLKLFADEEGVARVQVRPASASDQAARFVAECEADGKVMTHPIELRAAADPSPSFPAPAALRPNPAAQKGVVRPALEGDPMLLSESELLERGYPYRPDPKKAPDAYAGWLAAVSKPSIRITPKVVSRPDRFHGPAKTKPSSHWCGFATEGNPWPLSGDSSPFNWVMGEWIVPFVYPEPAHDTFGSTATYSSVWIGLDGDGSWDVVQDGTEQDVHLYFGGAWSVWSYYAWYEWFPAAEQEIQNFPVNPGDAIFSEVAVTGPDLIRNANGNIGYFYMENVSQGVFSTTLTTKPPNAFFLGNSAEWILEREPVNGVLPDLSKFGVVSMWSAAATRQDGDYPLAFQEPYDKFKMVNSVNQPLCTPTENGLSAMQFIWGGFN